MADDRASRCGVAWRNDPPLEECFQRCPVPLFAKHEQDNIDLHREGTQRPDDAAALFFCIRAQVFYGLIQESMPFSAMLVGLSALAKAKSIS